MNAKIVEARQRLARANDELRDRLRTVESLLRAAVAQDPANIDEAEAVRDQYGKHLLDLPPFAPLEQPLPDPGDPPVPEAEPAADEPPVLGAGIVESMKGKAVDFGKGAVATLHGRRRVSPAKDDK